METAAPMEKWENELHVFPLSHKRLENSSQKSRDEFSTVPTASTTGLCLKKEKEECDISNELKHVTFLKSFDTSFPFWGIDTANFATYAVPARLGLWQVALANSETPVNDQGIYLPVRT